MNFTNRRLVNRYAICIPIKSIPSMLLPPPPQLVNLSPSRDVNHAVNFYLPLLDLVTSSPFPLDFQILPRFSPLGPLKLLSSPEGGLNVPRMYKSKFKKSRRTSPQR